MARLGFRLGIRVNHAIYEAVRNTFEEKHRFSSTCHPMPNIVIGDAENSVALIDWENEIFGSQEIESTEIPYY